MGPEKRQQQRVALRATALLTDTWTICEGNIVDVSIGGMALDRVPSSMVQDLPGKFTAVVLFRECSAKVIMTPKWVSADSNGGYCTVGFQITGLFAGWQAFMKYATLPGASPCHHQESPSRNACRAEDRV